MHIQRWSHNAEVVSFCQVLRAVRGGLHKRGGGGNKRAGNAIPQFNTINITPNMNDDG